jgi:transmembrane sensor
MTSHPERPQSPADAALSDPAMDQALEWLVELEGADAEQRVRFQAWLTACPDNARAFASAEKIWNSQVIRQAAVALDRPARPSVFRRLRPHWKPLATAAVLLLGLFNFSNLPLRLQADHLTVVGERQRLQLADGSDVLLNTDSAFSSHFEAGQRRARLYQGEAWFNVPVKKTADQDAALEVEAGPIRMRASSTAFSVRYLDGVAQVKVQRGAVDVRAAQGDAQLSLAAGESVRFGPGGFGQREKLDLAKDLAWVQGRLIFADCPLGEVLSELRRYYPGLIINPNSALNQVAVTGNYRLDDPLNVVRSLAQVTSASLHEMPAMVVIN